MRWICLLSLVLLALLVAPRAAARADETAPDSDPDSIETVTLSLVAAPEPQPALKYHLLPTPAERTPGNAAPYYYRAMLLLTQRPKEHWKKYDERYEAWLANDREAYPEQEVAQWLAVQESELAQLKIATFRESCEWGLRVQDLRGMETINFLLHDMQQSRQLVRVLQLKAHHQLMTGQRDEALQTLRQGYQLAYDIGRTPILVNGLIGIAIAATMNKELQLLIERGGPNMYWALATLPQPLVDLRPALQYEMNLPFQFFPFLKDAHTAERTPEEWRRLISAAIVDFGSVSASGPATSGWPKEVAATAAMAHLYPIAKERLIAGGMDRSAVAAMPVGQVVAIHTARATESVYHEVFKVTLLPPAAALRQLPAVMQRLQRDVLRPDAVLSGELGIPIASVFLPGLTNVLHPQARSLRQFAALQTIEALRMHAAAHEGRLPKALSELAPVPAPSDVATNQPFTYSLDEKSGVATLEIPPLPAASGRGSGQRYVISLRK